MIGFDYLEFNRETYDGMIKEFTITDLLSNQDSIYVTLSKLELSLLKYKYQIKHREEIAWRIVIIDAMINIKRYKLSGEFINYDSNMEKDIFNNVSVIINKENNINIKDHSNEFTIDNLSNLNWIKSFINN